MLRPQAVFGRRVKHQAATGDSAVERCAIAKVSGYSLYFELTNHAILAAQSAHLVTAIKQQACNVPA
jgi:hypothetical protein